MQIPLKHHYLPVFYLRRWTNLDGRLCQFSQPYSEVKAKRVYPTQTAYRERLYELRGIAPADSQSVEQRFLRSLDSLAASALESLTHGPTRTDLIEPLRRGWAKFLLSTLMRCPEDISTLKIAVAEAWDRAMSDLEYNFCRWRDPSDPENFGDFFDHHALSIFPELIEHDPIVDVIERMIWIVRHIESEEEFLTSDRPILMSATLAERNAYIIMPIGPKTLFAAVIDEETGSIFEGRNLKELIATTNRLVTAHAVAYVYGTDDRKLEFVRSHISSRPQRSVLERLADSRRTPNS